jgi:tetratricopeptide (TPR) repeat protein
MRLYFILVVAVGLAISAADTGLAAEPAGKFALVIGNAKYPDSDSVLKETVNDSQDMAEELKRNNFDVETGINLTAEATRAALGRLYGKIKQGSVALIFFDGFAIQSGRQTYLIPVDAQIWTEPDVQRNGFSLETILGEMHSRGALVKVAILDASRRNPFERRFRPYSAGLAPVITPANTLVLYSAALGSVINDVETSHGLFVAEFLKEIRVPGIGAEQSMANIKAGVTRVSRGEQVPWFSSSLAIDFSFSSNPDRRPDRRDPPDKADKADPPVRPDPPDKPDGSSNDARKGSDAEVCVAAPSAIAPNLSELAGDRVISELSRRISANRNDKAAYYKRGQVYAQKGAYSLAVKDFDEVIAANRQDVEAYNNRCWTNAAGGDLQSGLKDCNEALRLRPGFVDALDSRGLINLKLARLEAAISDYSAALQTNPRSVSSLFGRGVAKQRSGTDGAADINAAKSLDPDIAKEFAKYGVSECAK